jgi:hypothetical protein
MPRLVEAFAGIGGQGRCDQFHKAPCAPNRSADCR